MSKTLLIASASLFLMLAGLFTSCEDPNKAKVIKALQEGNKVAIQMKNELIAKLEAVEGYEAKMNVWTEYLQTESIKQNERIAKEAGFENIAQMQSAAQKLIDKNDKDVLSLQTKSQELNKVLTLDLRPKMEDMVNATDATHN